MTTHNERYHKQPKRWGCRQFCVLLAIIGATFLAYVDASFRPSYSNILSIIIGGYFGQMKPLNGQ